MVSGTISLFCQKCFSPFPHGTSSLSVSQEYLALPDGPGGFTQNFSGSALLRILSEQRFVTCKGLSPSTVKLSRIVPLKIFIHITVLQPRNCRNNHGLGCSLFDRLYLGNRVCFIFLRVLRCFSSPGLPSVAGMVLLHNTGLPHSEIFGLKVICTSPKLIAASRVLHRL